MFVFFVFLLCFPLVWLLQKSSLSLFVFLPLGRFFVALPPLAIIGLVDASDACPEGEDCVPDSMLFLIFLGFCLLVLGGVAAGGIQINNNILIRVATLIMILASILLLLAALLMGISSGAVMDDMGYYYDTNYPKLRNTLEKVDNSYCRLTEDDCKTLTYDTTGNAKIYPKRCDDDGKQPTGIIRLPDFSGEEVLEHEGRISG